MKKGILLITTLFLTHFLSAKPRTPKTTALSNEQIVALIDEKKDAIKLEEVIKIYKDFVESVIKSEYISQFIKENVPRKENDKEDYFFFKIIEKQPTNKKAEEYYNKGLIDEALKEVGLSKEEVEREFEAQWYPTKTAELNFAGHFNLGKIEDPAPAAFKGIQIDDPNYPALYKKVIKNRKIQLSPAAYFIQRMFQEGGANNPPGPLEEKQFKKYKKPFKQRLAKELKLK